MPNQLSKEKQRFSISIPRNLVEDLDTIAALSHRDRTYVITYLLEDKLREKSERFIPKSNDMENAILALFEVEGIRAKLTAQAQREAAELHDAGKLEGKFQEKAKHSPGQIPEVSDCPISEEDEAAADALLNPKKRTRNLDFGEVPEKHIDA